MKVRTIVYQKLGQGETINTVPLESLLLQWG